jgi:hypothetical protein
MNSESALSPKAQRELTSSLAYLVRQRLRGTEKVKLVPLVGLKQMFLPLSA